MNRHCMGDAARSDREISGEAGVIGRRIDPNTKDTDDWMVRARE